MKRFKRFRVFAGGMLRRDVAIGPLVFSKSMYPMDDAGVQNTTYQVTLHLHPRLSLQWLAVTVSRRRR